MSGGRDCPPLYRGRIAYKNRRLTMKNLLVMTAVVLASVGLATTSFAATYSKGGSGVFQTIQGTVASLNQYNKTIVVKDNDDGKGYVVGLWADDFASLSQGQSVKVSLAQGNNLARSIGK
jgi:hypothetical protein